MLRICVLIYCNTIRRSRAVYPYGELGMNHSNNFKLLERLHCRAARGVFDLIKAKQDTLRTQYRHSILKITYKMYYNDSPPCMTEHIAKSQSPYNLRKSLKLEILRILQRYNSVESIIDWVSDGEQCKQLLQDDQ